MRTTKKVFKVREVPLGSDYEIEEKFELISHDTDE